MSGYQVLDESAKYLGKLPSWPGNGIPFSCIFGHDTEGGTGLAGARATLAWMVQTAAQRNASYHEFWAFDEGSQLFTALRVVSPLRAAGSVNPRPPTYAPDATARAALGANADDPNQGGYAVSIAGTVADATRYAGSAVFVAAARRRLQELRLELGLSRIVEHWRMQPSDRTDWGKVLTPKLTGPAWQLIGYRVHVNGTLTLYQVERFTHRLLHPKRVTFDHSQADVAHGSPGFWATKGGALDGLYYVAGHSGPFTITAQLKDAATGQVVAHPVAITS